MRLMMVSALAILMPAAGLGQDIQPPTGPAATAPTEEKKICRSVEVTGSRMPTRVCHTKAEWDQISRDGVDGVALLQQRQWDGTSR